MARIVADTSFLRALLLEDEPGHKEAERLALCADEIIAPSLVLHELVWSTRRSHGPARAQALVAYVLSEDRFRYEPLSQEDIWFGLRDPRRYEDLVILHVATRLGAALASFDKELTRLARRHGVTLHTCR